MLQAIALAGGLDRGRENLAGVVDGAREMERLRIATLQVDHLLARRARLEAERDGIPRYPYLTIEVSMWQTPDEGVSTISMPIQLANLDRARTAGTLLATESAILRAEQAKRRQQEEEIALKVAAARDEVNALKRKLDQFDVQKDLRIERLDAMQKLKDRGIVTSNNVLMLRTELADIEARRQDSLVAVVEAEARLAEAQGDGVKLSSEKTADLTKEIVTVDEEIAAAREATLSASVLATIFTETLAQICKRRPTKSCVNQKTAPIALRLRRHRR